MLHCPIKCSRQREAIKQRNPVSEQRLTHFFARRPLKSCLTILRCKIIALVCAHQSLPESMMNQKPSRPAKKPASMLDRLKAVNWPFLIFLGSLGFMTMLYGMMAMKYKLPPYAQVDHAIKAVEALSNMEDETLASSVNHIAENETPKPSFTTLDPAAGKELLLVTGGPNQDAVHCPKFGCLAWIIDRSGKVLHSWPLPLDTCLRMQKTSSTARRNC